MYPHLFKIGPLTLYSFGLMVVVGFVAGAWLAGKLARERGLPGDAFSDGGVLILFASIAGARLLYVMLNLGEYSARPTGISETWRGGMSFHGGAAAGILSGLLYMRWRRLPLLPLADAAAPGLALGYAIGRIGCLLNGCCYGGPTSLPWGLHFPAEHAHPGQLYHPAQVYAALANLALMALLIAAYRRPHRDGQVLALYVGGYSVYRFLIEIVRKGTTADVFAFGLTEAQVFSLAAIVVSGLAWLWLQKRPGGEVEGSG